MDTVFMELRKNGLLSQSIKIVQSRSFIDVLCIVSFLLSLVTIATLNDDPQLYVYNRVAMFSFMALTMLSLLTKRKIIVRKGFYFLIGFLFIETFSLFFSYNIDVSFRSYLTQIQLFAFCVCIYLYFLNIGEQKHLLYGLYLAAFFTLVLALLRYGGISNFLNLMRNGERMGGKIGNENAFGLTFAWASLAAFWYMVRGKKYIHILPFFIFIFFALSSGSRKVLFVLIFGVVVLLLLRFGFRRIYKPILIFLILGLIFYNVLKLDIFDTFVKRANAFLEGGTDFSTQGRLEMISAGWSLFLNNPFGYGLGSFAVLSGYGVYSHNGFIELLTSLGIFGFLYYYSIYLLFIASFLRYFKQKNKDDYYSFLVVYVIGSLVLMIGQVSLYSKTDPFLMASILVSLDSHKYTSRIYNDNTFASRDLAKKGE